MRTRNDYEDLLRLHLEPAFGATPLADISVLSAAELDALGAAMVSDERSLLAHSHPTLPDSGPVAAVTRKVAEAVDNLRDRSADVGRTTT